jgi:hypothetical protein
MSSNRQSRTIADLEGRDVVDARWRAKAHIYPTLGDKQCGEGVIPK